MACVYLISESPQGPVKVGVANNPATRIRELQCGNPNKLKLADWWRFGTRDEAFVIERLILDEMAPYRMTGEWVDADEFGMRGLILSRITERYSTL
ncbi:GIY-YIG nuclease family protein [Tardiphaga sp. 841_E9_N1_2]|uniref:GIY-YIG nuclease family protein n=1 Tax=Tardiphaga sp. 841_E9_N1_2 TaxID=3240762 RepID=UPI003F20FDD8